MNKKKLFLWIATFIVFGLLFSAVDPAQAVEALVNARPLPLLAAAALTFLFPVLSALRWKWIMMRLDAPIPFWDSLKLILAAWPLATVTPAKSGDLIKVIFLKNVLPYGQTSGLLIAERLIDVAVLSFSASLGGFLLGLPSIAAIGGAIFSGVVGAFIFLAIGLSRLLPQKYRTLGDDVILASQRLYSDPSAFFWIVLLTFANWFASYLQTWLCYQSLQAVVPLGYVCAALPVAIFVGLLPITTAGMGTRDAAMIYLFQGFAAYETNLAVGVLYSIFGYWVLTLAGLPFMRMAFNGNLLGLDRSALQIKINQPRLDSKENNQ